MGTKRKPHPLDDELVKKCGAESLDKLRASLMTISEQRKSQEENNELRQQVSRRLINEHDFQVPEFLKKTEYLIQIARHGATEDDLSEENKNSLMEMAERNVRLSLILDSIREKEPDAVLSDAEAEGAIKQRAVLQRQDPEQVLVEFKKSGAFEGMVASLRDEFTLQWLVSQSKIVE
jgi:FKBP-type peptidyl-prolyl cis-trans isomerase (trigger factor)